ncbi:small cysteine-rich protein 3-like [Acropora muricata]|uniref:small cysteine-rich protein 3-like n=1 Tax=Acropora muricata TaxID=159855 RepID=UPI0034E4BFB5
MGVKLYICLLLLLVAIISSQGFNLREEDHSKDGKPFAIHLPDDYCSGVGGYCISTSFLCKDGYHECVHFADCDLDETCCCPDDK